MSSFAWQMIKSADSLNEFVRRLSREPLFAIDLEADSLHHYKESLCLMQVSTRTEHALIDLLALPHIDPLLPLLHDPGMEKVLHGADYDVRLLNREYGVVMENLFDTQIAAQFLGVAQFGLSALLKAHFDVDLDKRYQKKDWSVRPLPREMLEYAVNDTAFLLPLQEILRKSLKENGRLSWVTEECRLLSRCAAKVREAPSCFDIKGSGRLAPQQLAVLQSLVDLRDKVAQEWDRPPFKVLSSETLVELAVKQPASAEELAGIHGITPKVASRLGGDIQEAIRRGVSTPEEHWPKFPKTPRLARNPFKEKRLELLAALRDKAAGELALPPSLLCPRAPMEVIANTPAASAHTVVRATLKDWQYGLLGRGFEEVLHNP